MCERKGFIFVTVFQGLQGDTGKWTSQDTHDAKGLGLPSYMGMICGTQEQLQQ